MKVNLGKQVLTIIVSLYLTSCGVCDHCPANYFTNITSLEINPDITTPLGINIDSGGVSIDPVEIERRVEAIYNCLLDTAQLPQPEWQCIRDMEIPDLSCITVKIVPPIYSKCSDWEFIGVLAPEELCEVKGVSPTSECPCMWRTAVQNDWVVITPPKIYLWELGRIFTSCNNIWQTPYTRCLGL